MGKKKIKRIKPEENDLPTKSSTKSKVVFDVLDSETGNTKNQNIEAKSSTILGPSNLSFQSSTTLGDLCESSSSEETLVQPEKKKSKHTKKKKKEKTEKQPKKKVESQSDESGKKKKKKKTEFKEIEKKTPTTSGKEVKIDLAVIRTAQLGTLTTYAETAAAGAVEEPKKRKNKKKKKKAHPKKNSKEDKKVLQEQEDAEARRLLEEKQRLENQRIEELKKYNREILEEEIREEQLAKSIYGVNKIYENYTELIREKNIEKEWIRYIACGRLPNPMKCDEMTTYIHLWDNVISKTSIEEASLRTRDVLQLLNEIDDILDTALPEYEHNTDKLKWIHQMLREHQNDSLTVATYQLLLWVEKKLNRIDLSTADFHFKDENLIFSLWLKIQLPIPLPNPRRPPKPKIDISFPNIPMRIRLPPNMDCAKMAIRGMHLKYDHLSDQSENFYLPSVEPDFNQDLLTHVKYEWRFKQMYRYFYKDSPDTQTQISQVKSAVSDKSDKISVASSSATNLNEFIIKALEKINKENESRREDEEIPIVPYQKLEPSPSNLFLVKDFMNHESTVEKFILDIPLNTVNLREFVILGGIFYFNIVYQPPQPQEFVTLELVLSRFLLPKNLGYFTNHLTSPQGSLSEEGQAFSVASKSSHLIAGIQDTRTIVSGTKSAQKMEEMRKSRMSALELSKSVSLLKEEMKRSRMSAIEQTEKVIEIVEEPDDLIYMTLEWPKNVIFFELPNVCHWDELEKCWSTKNIHQERHNTENNTVDFKTDVLGAFAFATRRYVHFPYTNWKIKARPDGSVIIILRATLMNFQFNIKNGLICLDTYEVYPNPILQPLEQVYMKLSKLIRALKGLGIDIFPEPDAVCYVPDNCEKLWAFEKHLYCDIARLYNCFNFAKSKFNTNSGRRNILFQMKQTFLPKNKNYLLVHVTPVKATFLQCQENSEIFSFDEMENMRFSSDLYHLMKNTCGIIVRNQVQEAPPENVVILAEFLIATRVLSFSE